VCQGDFILRMTPPWATDGTAVRDDYAAGLWDYALTGRQKLPVYKNVLYYSASKRYFRAPGTPRRGNLVL